MKKILYHGTCQINALSILKNGFDFSKCGSNWGSTYGRGIYFTPNYTEAEFYAVRDGIVLSFVIDVECYYLKKDISPSKKRKFILPDGYNCLVNPSENEYVVFSFISPLVNQLFEVWDDYYSIGNYPLERKQLYKLDDDILINMILETVNNIMIEGKLEEYSKNNM